MDARDGTKTGFWVVQLISLEPGLLIGYRHVSYL